MNRMRQSQRGAVLLVMLLIVALGASYFMVSRLQAMAIEARAADRAYNAAVLMRAKQALIGYVAAQAAKAGENNPGALPCPESPAYFYDTANESEVSSYCSLTQARLTSMRTLWYDKLSGD